jgi:hypothetical protein
VDTQNQDMVFDNQKQLSDAHKRGFDDLPHNVIMNWCQSDLPGITSELFFLLHYFAEVRWFVGVNEPDVVTVSVMNIMLSSSSNRNNLIYQSQYFIEKRTLCHQNIYIYIYSLCHRQYTKQSPHKAMMSKGQSCGIRSTKSQTSCSVQEKSTLQRQNCTVFF